MNLESRMFLGTFAACEVVQLRQMCFTPARVFMPGLYLVEELPQIAFQMGLVEQQQAKKEGKPVAGEDPKPVSDNDAH